MWYDCLLQCCWYPVVLALEGTHIILRYFIIEIKIKQKIKLIKIKNALPVIHLHKF